MYSVTILYTPLIKLILPLFYQNSDILVVFQNNIIGGPFIAWYPAEHKWF